VSNRGFGVLLAWMMGALAVALVAVACAPSPRGDVGDGASIAPADTVLREATVAQILDGRVPVGQTVRVRGRCLGYGASLGDEGPPLTRSDWLLEGDGRRIYVSGAYPPGCSATTPAESPATIRAEVAEDTLAGLGAQAPRTRRYLVRLPDA
jgi:hypothetical protein